MQVQIIIFTANWPTCRTLIRKLCGIAIYTGHSVQRTTCISIINYSNEVLNNDKDQYTSSFTCIRVIHGSDLAMHAALVYMNLPAAGEPPKIHAMRDVGRTMIESSCSVRAEYS